MPKAKSTRSKVKVKEEEPVESAVPDDFHQRVYAIVRQIPEGRVCSYGTIAKLLHHPRHSRMVGQALKLLPRAYASPHLPLPPQREGSDDDPNAVLPAPPPNPEWVPWHRVVSSSGVISPRGNVGAVRRQGEYLEAEGVEVRDGPRAGGGGWGGGGGGDGAGPAGVDAFGLGGVDGGRVSMTRYGWSG